jgi:hypothetical protein
VYLHTSDSTFFARGRISDLTNANAPAILRRTINLNYWASRSIVGDRSVNDTQAMRIAYLRVLGLIIGTADVTGTPNSHNCQYSDIRLVPDDHEFQVQGAANAAGPARVELHNSNDDPPNFFNPAEVDWRIKTKKKVINMICIIAFFMRTRGHHYTDEMDDRYKAVWRKCLYDEDDPGLAWTHIAHNTFHYIYPDDLDNIWGNNVISASCAGALVKRYASYSAGTAAVGAVAVGAADVLTVFPRLREVMADAFNELDRCMTVLRTHRWAGAITRRFYRGPALNIDEKRLGALAAVIIGALNTGATTSPLRNSRALMRVAENAPITGGFITSMLTKASQDERLVNALFVEAEEAD